MMDNPEPGIAARAWVIGLSLSAVLWVVIIAGIRAL